MSLARMFRHMFAPPVSRAFDDAALERLAGMIAEDEARHRGEVVFADFRLDAQRLVEAFDGEDFETA